MVLPLAAELALALSLISTEASRDVLGDVAAPAARPEMIRLAKPARRSSQPLKDCTRYNSRYGFYGNIWCSEREQQLWDRYGTGRKRTKS